MGLGSKIWDNMLTLYLNTPRLKTTNWGQCSASQQKEQKKEFLPNLPRFILGSLITVPINFWWSSDHFFLVNKHFGTEKFTEWELYYDWLLSYPCLLIFDDIIIFAFHDVYFKKYNLKIFYFSIFTEFLLIPLFGPLCCTLVFIPNFPFWIIMISFLNNSISLYQKCCSDTCFFNNAWKSYWQHLLNF